VTARHYENFPVGSILLPARIRPAVAAIYWFARSADDIADEGDDPAPQRLARLEEYRVALGRIASGGQSDSPQFAALAAAIARHALPLQPFHDLLDAFAQDVVKQRYANFAEVVDYCRRSANPVGLLMLHLFEAAKPQHVAWSDAICTALQLTNFWQDIAIDYRKGRVYLPQDELAQHGVSEADIAGGRTGAAWRRLLAFEVARTRAMLVSGAPLARALAGRIGWEVRVIVQGGLRILERIERAEGDVFRHRPVLRPADWCVMGWRAARGWLPQ
jgi:squalene synthase HpnC